MPIRHGGTGTPCHHAIGFGSRRLKATVASHAAASKYPPTTSDGAANVEELAKLGVTGVNVMTRVTTETIDKLAAMVQAGVLKRPHIETYRLDQAGQAFVEVSTGHVRGKLVVVP